MNRDLYSILYECDYNVANLVDVAEKIKREQESVLSVLSIKHLAGFKPFAEKVLS